MSFIDERVLSTGLTFDDVLLVPAYSEVMPRTVSTETRFSRNIKLNIPNPSKSIQFIVLKHFIIFVCIPFLSGIAESLT